MVTGKSVLGSKTGAGLSIVITSYDPRRREYVERAIHSLCAQKSQSFNLILVIEKDRELYEYFRKYLKTTGLANSDVVFNDSLAGISASRNLGIHCAQSDVVAVIDDDVLAPTGWVSGVLELFSNKDIAAATGPVIPLWEDKSLEWLRPEFHWLVGCSTWSDNTVLSETRNVWGANMAFRRAGLLATGGFSTQVGGMLGKRLHGEENELSIRLKRSNLGRIVFSPAMRIYHYVPRRRFNVRAIIRSSFDMGRTRILYENDLSALSGELSTVSRIVKDIFRSVLTFAREPRRTFSTFSLSMIVLFFAGLGYGYGIASKLHVMPAPLRGTVVARETSSTARVL